MNPSLRLAQREARKAREATIARDAAIVAAHTDGVPVATIAKAVGMTGPGVRRVLKRDGHDAP